MDHLSYIEVNVVCALLLFIVFLRQFSNRSIVTLAQIYMKNLILTSCILCVSDILAMACRGQMFDGARIIIQLSNLVYIESMPVISMLWLKYVCAKTGIMLSKIKNALVLTPLLLFSLVAISNPFTSFLFSIDENNRYVRGTGVFIHWIVSWAYLIVAAVISHKAVKSAQSWRKKNEYKPLLIFIVCPTICCVIQMLVYGISAIQVGITLSIVLVNFRLLENRISVDELTGINNRKEMSVYVDRLINRYKPVSICALMIDVNGFKQINDTLGHNVGDEALQAVASALKNVCDRFSEHMFLCRYGGDEFVIIVKDIDAERVAELKNNLKSEVKAVAGAYNRPYELSISVGYNAAVCENYEDFADCIKLADEAMYLEKGKAKRRFVI